MYSSSCLKVNIEVSSKNLYSLTEEVVSQLYLPNADMFLKNGRYFTSTRVKLLSTKIMQSTSDKCQNYVKYVGTY